MRAVDFALAAVAAAGAAWGIVAPDAPIFLTSDEAFTARLLYVAACSSIAFALVLKGISRWSE